MYKKVKIIAAIVLVLHGLIHLMGTVTYMKLGSVEGLTYKPTVLDGYWGLGEAGINLFGGLWAVAAAVFLVASFAMLVGWDRWRSALAGATILSLVLTALDWNTAFAGVILNIVILAVVAFGPSMANRLYCLNYEIRCPKN
jgi:hypothetical protein